MLSNRILMNGCLQSNTNKMHHHYWDETTHTFRICELRQSETASEAMDRAQSEAEEWYPSSDKGVEKLAW